MLFPKPTGFALKQQYLHCAKKPCLDPSAQGRWSACKGQRKRTISHTTNVAVVMTRRTQLGTGGAQCQMQISNTDLWACMLCYRGGNLPFCFQPRDAKRSSQGSHNQGSGGPSQFLSTWIRTAHLTSMAKISRMSLKERILTFVFCFGFASQFSTQPRIWRPFQNSSLPHFSMIFGDQIPPVVSGTKLQEFTQENLLGSKTLNVLSCCILLVLNSAELIVHGPQISIPSRLSPSSPYYQCTSSTHR